MINRIEPKSEWDRRYAAYQAREERKKERELAKAEKQAEARLNKIRNKPGPKKGQPMPKNKPMGTIVLNLWGTKE